LMEGMKTQLLSQKRVQVLTVFALVSCGFVAACSTSGKWGKNAAPTLAVKQAPEQRAISEATGKDWIVSTQGRAATKAVDTVFAQGGNIIDAAIAASFAISVERPQ